MEAFDEYINNLQNKSSSLEAVISNVQAINKESSELKAEIEAQHTILVSKLEELTEREDSLSQLMETTEMKRAELEDMLNEEEETSEALQEILAESKTHGEV